MADLLEKDTFERRLKENIEIKVMLMIVQM